MGEGAISTWMVTSYLQYSIFKDGIEREEVRFIPL